MILFIAVWLALGTIGWYIAVKANGQVTVVDLGMLMLVSMLGPIALIMSITANYNNKIVWRFKK